MSSGSKAPSKESPVVDSPFAEHFESQGREAELYAMWERSGVFSFSPAQAKKGTEPFVICMPPPNANGELHLGHSYGYSVMDAFGRYFRAQGRPVLLLPGKDHAGIQTQVVFENKLRAAGSDLSKKTREELFDDCYAFCMDRATYMRAQEKQLGLSADWEREFFTLDPRVSRVVYETFAQLWNDGLIYRGKRIVNWSVLSGTAISDVEVERKEVDGTLTYIRYPFVGKVPAARVRTVAISPDSSFLPAGGGVWFSCGSSGFSSGDVITYTREGAQDSEQFVCVESKELRSASMLKKALEDLAVPEDAAQVQSAVAELATKGGIVSKFVPYFEVTEGLFTATTRPETMLGDTALAVHPKDPRYAHLVGSSVQVPLIGRQVPIVADDRVELAFGAGVVKVTPAHDFLDFDIGQTHKLPMVQVIGTDGKMTAEAGPYAGLDAKQCRARVVQDLEKAGLVLKVEKIKHKVPIAERSKDVIEPLLSEQWFIAVDAPGKSLKANALKFLEDNKIEIHPPHFKKEFEHWLKNLRDWNISRQLWWGHRLPVWYKDGPGGKVETYVGAEAPQGDAWRQEPDTFDTWFSSGQWAFSTLAACGELDPATGKSPHGAFPSQCMVMGRDILFFWACRMLLLTAYRMKQVPWKSIYFTGLIRDEQGQKMSKSKGNGIEPGVVIAKYGADALRLALLFGTTPGNDVNMGEGKIGGYSKFINKIWNAAKLLHMRVLGEVDAPIAMPQRLSSDAAAWIVRETQALRGRVTYLMNSYQLGQALNELYGFTWDTYCDWYLEIAKILARDESAEVAQQLRWSAQYSFGSLLEMLHPFLPFLTEEIYQKLPGTGSTKTLCQAHWRGDCLPNAASTANVGTSHVIEIVKAIRSHKVSLGGLGSGIPVTIVTEPLSDEGKLLVQELGRVRLVASQDIPAERRVTRSFSQGVITFDHPDRQGFAAKLKKEADALRENVERLTQRLQSDFAQRAKPEIVQAEREKLATAQQTLARLADELKALG